MEIGTRVSGKTTRRSGSENMRGSMVTTMKGSGRTIKYVGKECMSQSKV
jgi:hypothetical protein